MTDEKNKLDLAILTGTSTYITRGNYGRDRTVTRDYSKLIASDAVVCNDLSTILDELLKRRSGVTRFPSCSRDNYEENEARQEHFYSKLLKDEEEYFAKEISEKLQEKNYKSKNYDELDLEIDLKKIFYTSDAFGKQIYQFEIGNEESKGKIKKILENIFLKE